MRSNLQNQAQEKNLLSGSKAVARAVEAARVRVITAYPIVPQTEIVETLERVCVDGSLAAKFMHVESAHSALSTLIGASATGVRTFTATSSQSLAAMHELLHWTAGDRLPIVIANVNRALGAPWSMWVDHNDSLSQRDTGWVQFYVGNAQEAYDVVLQAYRLAELISLPVMINLDGFFVSHTHEAVELLDQASVDNFLPAFRPATPLDTQKPCSIGNITSPDNYLEFRYQIQQAMEKVPSILSSIQSDYDQLTGRRYRSVDSLDLAGADVVFISYASMAQTVRHTVQEMRGEGVKVGAITINLFRPFPIAELQELMTSSVTYIVLDRNISFGSGGIFGQEIRSALQSCQQSIRVVDVTLGLGGRDVTPAGIRSLAEHYSGKHPETGEYRWEGVKA